MRKLMWVGGLAALLAVSTRGEAQSCAGDCNGDGSVAVNELVSCVNIALGNAALASCMACDSNNDGTVAVTDLITAVNAALNGCNFTPGPTPTRTPGGGAYCGDGAVNVAGEECDDGNNVGGDGCAANCTEEIVRRTTLDPNQSRSVLQFAGLVFPQGGLQLTGTQALTGGSPRDTAVFGAGGVQLFAPGEFPVVIKAEDIRFNPITLSGIGCACVRGVAVPEFGEGIAGVGVVGCGDQGLMNVDFLVEQDHNTTPSSPGNRVNTPPNGFPDDPDCTNTFELEGGGFEYNTCFEGIGPACRAEANIHNVCQSPRHVTFSGGQAPRGSVLIRNSTAIALLMNNVPDACARRCVASFGEDCLPCTEDDPDKGVAQIAPTTSGTARVAIFDTYPASQACTGGNLAACRLSGDGTCGGLPCVASVTGQITDCDTLQDPERGLTGALVTAFPALDQALGDALVTTTLKAQQ